MSRFGELVLQHRAHQHTVQRRLDLTIAGNNFHRVPRAKGLPGPPSRLLVISDPDSGRHTDDRENVVVPTLNLNRPRPDVVIGDEEVVPTLAPTNRVIAIPVARRRAHSVATVPFRSFSIRMSYPNDDVKCGGSAEPHRDHSLLQPPQSSGSSLRNLALRVLTIHTTARSVVGSWIISFESKSVGTWYSITSPVCGSRRSTRSDMLLVA